MYKIALCAGHTSRRRGAINKNYNLNEYDCSTHIIDIASSVLSREFNVDIISGTLGEKVNKINAGEYDLAIDYHFNADAELLDTDDSKGYGCMVMHVPTSLKRKEQADRFSSIMASYLGEKDRGGRKGYYWGGTSPGTKGDYFLTKTNCAAFIPEPGFIDNNGFAEKFLLSDDGHIKLSYALTLAIRNFFKDKGLT